MKKIVSIQYTHEIDESPDLSYLGTFSDTPADKFCVEIPNATRNQYKYFNADNVENDEQAQQNFNEMMEYENGNKVSMGIGATAKIATSQDGGKTWLHTTEIKTFALWGIDSDDIGYIKDIERDRLEDLKVELKEFGFSDEEINAAEIKQAK